MPWRMAPPVPSHRRRNCGIEVPCRWCRWFSGLRTMISGSPALNIIYITAVDVILPGRGEKVHTGDGGLPAAGSVHVVSCSDTLPYCSSSFQPFSQRASGPVLVARVAEYLQAPKLPHGRRFVCSMPFTASSMASSCFSAISFLTAPREAAGISGMGAIVLLLQLHAGKHCLCRDE